MAVTSPISSLLMLANDEKYFAELESSPARIAKYFMLFGNISKENDTVMSLPSTFTGEGFLLYFIHFVSLLTHIASDGFTILFTVCSS